MNRAAAWLKIAQSHVENPDNLNPFAKEAVNVIKDELRSPAFASNSTWLPSKLQLGKLLKRKELAYCLLCVHRNLTLEMESVAQPERGTKKLLVDLVRSIKADTIARAEIRSTKQ